MDARGSAGDLNRALMELGATICLPNGAPRCGDCPLQHLCLGYHHKNASSLPLRAAKKARRIEKPHRTARALRHARRPAAAPSAGLLAGLWELPSLDGHLSPEETRSALAGLGWQLRRMLSLRPAGHIFTHVEWHMNGYYIELDNQPEPLTFVSPPALRATYALPSAFRAFLQRDRGGTMKTQTVVHNFRRL